MFDFTSPLGGWSSRVRGAGRRHIVWCLVSIAAAWQILPMRGDADELDEPQSIGVPRQLTRGEIEAGWIALFDGESLFGWRAEGDADFRAETGIVRADTGSAPCLLRTTSQFDDFEFVADFQGDVGTNSGIFVRTPPRPTDPTADCFEINIATSELSPFPTGSIVGRSATRESFDPQSWHRMTIRATAGNVVVTVDGQATVSIDQALPLGRGFIGLQYNSGPISFCNVFIRPLELRSETIPFEQEAWRIGPQPGALTLSHPDEMSFRLADGVGFVESRETYGDFILQLDARTGAVATNSGLFFRCIPGSDLDGYESQIHHGTIDGDRSKPLDYGTGGIFRRSPARRVVSDDLTWFTKTLIVEGNHLAVWVDGLQVVDWTDEREPDPNPRRGARREPGTLALQLHDDETSVDFRRLRIRELERRVR